MTVVLDALLGRYADFPDWSDGAPDHVHARNRYGDSVLDTAVVEGKITDVRLLLEHGADVNAAGEHGYTPLHSAVEQGHANIVRLLVAWGADNSARTVDGLTPSDLAELLGGGSISRLLAGSTGRTIG